MNISTMNPYYRWGTEELMYACRIAAGKDFSYEVYVLIADELNRTPKSVSAAMNRVLHGTSFIFKTTEAARFKRFVKSTQKSIPQYKRDPKVTAYTKPLPSRQVKTQSGFSIKLLWGFLEIKRQAR